LLVEDADASRKLVSTLEKLIENEGLRTSLSSNIKKIAVTDAAEQIAKIALDLVK
jgi:UDP-N-acetylglucosamine:LPS N-acetylglucosamine transferase